MNSNSSSCGQFGPYGQGSSSCPSASNNPTTKALVRDVGVMLGKILPGNPRNLGIAIRAMVSRPLLFDALEPLFERLNLFQMRKCQCHRYVDGLHVEVDRNLNEPAALPLEPSRAPATFTAGAARPTFDDVEDEPFGL